MLPRTLFALLFAISATICSGATIPVANLSAINWANVKAGDTLVLTRSTYSEMFGVERGGVAGKPLVIMSASGTRAKISVGTRYAHAVEIAPELGYIVFRDIEFIGGKGDSTADATVHLLGPAHHLRFENCHAEGGAANGFFGEGSGGDALELINCVARYNARRGAVAPGNLRKGFLAEDCLFELNESDGLLINSSYGKVLRCRFRKNGYDSNGVRVTSRKPIHGIYMYPYGEGGRNWLIQDCVMDENRGSAARITGQDNLFLNNTVLNSPVFVYVPNLEGGNAGNVVARNRFYAIAKLNELRPAPDEETNYGPGIQVEGAVDLLIEDNDIVGAGISVDSQFFEKTGKVVNSENVKIRRNRIEMVLDDRFIKVVKGQGTGFVSADNVFASKESNPQRRWEYEGVVSGLTAWKQRVNDRSSVFVDANKPTTLVAVRFREEGSNPGAVYRVEHVQTASTAESNPVVKSYTDAATPALVRRTYRFDGTVPASQIRFRYLNDAANRDLNVDYLEINGVRYESESPRTYSTGTWSDANGCGPGYKQRSTLHCPGFFQFDVPPAANARSEHAGEGSETETAALAIYPNPSNGAVRIQLPKPMSSKTPVTLSIYDATGREVYTRTGLDPATSVELDLDLTPGVYLLGIREEGGSLLATWRLVRQ